MTRCIDVILPLAISGAYTYSVPEDIPYPQAGMRVLVPLGRKSITGVVLDRRNTPIQKNIALRDILCVLDQDPIVTKDQLNLWQWISEYYMCTLGEVLAAALPAGIIDEDYTLPTISYIALSPKIDLQKTQELLRNKRAHKQLHVLEQYLRIASQSPQVERRLLIETSGESAAIVRAMVEREILVETKQQASRLLSYTGPIEQAHSLSPAQAKAVEEIQNCWQEHEVCLLHGVTSSGKTEVYIHLIKQALAKNRNVLYLVPEIALTTQLTDRLQKVFGKQLVVYHSRFSNAERAEIYHSILKNQTPQVIIGARSAVFLPFRNLDLIIVDEEHETSYKQADPAPRYHARSTAIILAQQIKAKVLLGSATPSIESYYNTLTGKYGLVQLSERYAGLQLPRTTCINLHRQYHRKEMYGHFSDPLVSRIQEELAQYKQVILFQNRRGYAPLLQCVSCGKTPRCVNCDAPLTVHLKERQLRCHCCGYSAPIPPVCPTCGSELRVHGFGTERIEDEVATYFPKAKVLRMDLDATRKKTSYQDIINAFSRHEVDILIGTQMVTKGLHFDDVSLVAVLNADQLLNQPDFRSTEHTFQMLEQVAGRAGRKGKQGEVIIQTFEPSNPIFNFLKEHDYQAFFNAEIKEREMYHYPPFDRIISLSLRHRYQQKLYTAALLLQTRLMQIFGDRVSKVITPSITRIKNLYLSEIRIRIENSANIQRAKQLISEQIHYIQTVPDCKGTIILPDVDPS
ncbi:MAG: primosomal protein N' [Paludibacteraceae bacterium]